MELNKYYALKRIHSLTGVLPFAGFVIFHLFENSNSVAGAEAFNQTTHLIRHQPYLKILELGLLGPILFHAIFGIYIAKTAKHNVGQFGTRANWSYTLQRVTGGILLFFIGFHVWTTRFADIPTDQMFQRIAEMYGNPLVFGFYLLGVAAAAFHLANGLFGFAIAWGLVTGQKSQDYLWKTCAALGVAVFLMGTNAALGFKGKGVSIFNHVEPAASAAPAPVAPSQPAH